MSQRSWLMPTLTVIGFLAAVGCSAVLPPSPSASSSPSTGTNTNPVSTTAVSFKTDVVPVLQAHCAACHKPGGQAPWAMFNADGSPNYDNVKARISDMISAIDSGAMPLGMPHTVSAAEEQKLKDWKAAGTPNN